MTLVGVGIDLASISRIGRLQSRYAARFERRWFEPSEIPQPGAGPAGLARSFAVKEAVWKALPHDAPGPLPWREIVTHQSAGDGRMIVELRDGLAAEAARHGVTSITASTTILGDLVLAVALAEGGAAE